MLALEDVPVRSRVAEIAVPEYQGSIGFDHLKGMIACSTWHGHFEGIVRSGCESISNLKI